MKTELCSFTGFKIYPGKGKIFVRGDSKSFRFINGKAESYFLQRLKPSKLDWTVVFRRLRKKGITEEVSKKRSRRTVKVQRAVVGADLDAIKAKRNMKPEVRAAQRDQLIKSIKEKKKTDQDKKKTEKQKVIGFMNNYSWQLRDQVQNLKLVNNNQRELHQRFKLNRVKLNNKNLFLDFPSFNIHSRLKGSKDST